MAELLGFHSVSTVHPQDRLLAARAHYSAGWLRGLPGRGSRHRARGGCAPTCRPIPTDRSSRTPSTSAADPWVSRSTGSPSTERRKCRSAPHAHPLSACARRAWPARSTARSTPIHRPSNHLGSEARGAAALLPRSRYGQCANGTYIHSNARENVTTDVDGVWWSMCPTSR